MNARTRPRPQSVRHVAEIPAGSLPTMVHPEWREELPWLVQGTTARGADGEPFDLGLYAEASPAGAVLGRWDRLRSATGMATVIHGFQEHGAAVRFHHRGTRGLCVAEACDGHATADAGVLLAVTVADCVPVSIVDPERRAVALLHAGWRGAAGGILERGLAVLSERVGTAPAGVRVHLGPAICGRCYEVGPEVFEALRLNVPAGPAPLDLRGTLALRAAEAGVPVGRISISGHCTRCGEGWFSHRGGDEGRQVGYLGVRV